MKKRRENEITRMGGGGSFEICDLKIAHFAYKLHQYHPDFLDFLSFSVSILFLLKRYKTGLSFSVEKNNYIGWHHPLVFVIHLRALISFEVILMFYSV